MSLLQVIKNANNAKAKDYFRLSVNGRWVGFVRKENLALLNDYGCNLKLQNNFLSWQDLGSLEKNTEFFASAVAKMAKDGVVKGVRNELYPLADGFFNPPIALIERAAIPFFGTAAYGVHLNGLVKKDNELLMWIAKRSKDKPTSPNKLDQIAAGGLPYGISPLVNMQKEAEEEAGINLELSQKIISVGSANYFRQISNKSLRADVMFLYDLWLPEEFLPVNQDGEVAEFRLMPLTKIIEELKNPDTAEPYKYNSALVMIDCAIRYGIVNNENEPEFLEICQFLHNKFI